MKYVYFISYRAMGKNKKELNYGMTTMGLTKSWIDMSEDDIKWVMDKLKQSINNPKVDFLHILSITYLGEEDE